jgi:ABC-type multidrug transport system fused ATPase/permease subunit
VLVDGRELDEASLRSWRRCVAWVPQRATLFNGTVADNIRLGEPAAHDERVASAARLAGADDFIVRLPDGYATVVGDGGRPLSAGETQRIALARAFLRDARLVVLDEPTANLDPVNARALDEAIARLATGRTTLVIAHRPELVERADRVVRLEGGRVREVELALGAA